MAVKEFRQALRSRLFLIPFMLVHGLMLGALGFEWSSLQGHGSSWWGSLSFWLATYLVVALLMPLRGFNAMQEEAMERNAEMLAMAGLTRWRVVRGKWLVQAGLAMLVLSSLLPYFIVRYFFGAFDLWVNLIQLGSVLGCGLGNSALIIGASGYASYPVRLTVIAISLTYVLGASMALSLVVAGSFFAMTSLMAGFVGLFSVGVMLIAILSGLQLGRAHLRRSLVPWEPSPTRTMVTLIVCLPFILTAGTVATLLWGGVVVEAVIVIGLLRYDRQL